jgi:hypothetical protein
MLFDEVDPVGIAFMSLPWCGSSLPSYTGVMTADEDQTQHPSRARPWVIALSAPMRPTDNT